MAQYNTQKNPPWVRDGTGLPQPGVAVVAGMGQAVPIATPTVYSLATTQISAGQPQYTTQLQQQLGVANLTAVAQLPQPGIAIPTTLASQITQVQNVSYPAPRTQVAPGGQPKQRVFTGTVTKLHDSFGFVDEDVFFQTSCVKGALPKVGDRVLVEASYNANMPFKWNATRIQVLPSQQKPAVQQTPPGLVQGFTTSKPPPNIQHSQPQFSQPPPPLMSQNTQPPANLRGQQPPPPGSRRLDPPSYDRGGRDRERERRSPPRRQRSPPRKRSRSPRRRSRSPARRTSPVRSRRPQRVAPRYQVQVPKISLDTKEANVIAVKCRYTNMYIPSDFFHSTFSWVEAFPLHRPFELGKQCTYHVMHKEVDPTVKHDAILEPPDADHLYSAKVMLSASPTIEDLYKKSCSFVEDNTDNRENLQHPTRLVNFLVGLKGKEPMAIGGPWSPSLDGSHPADDPRVLINTAIRTTRALTGIDLAGVTQWYRFAEIRYHRPEEVHKGRVVPARVETVVLFLPDVWSCNPSRIEWDGLAVAYKRQLTDKYKEDTHEETQDDEEEDADATAGEIKDPTHHSELDPKTMKVNDLRKELEARALSSKGLKSQLIARLTKAIKSEVEKEEEEAENKDEDAEPESSKEPEQTTEKEEDKEKEDEKKRREDEDKKRREEREKVIRERRYTLPDTPAILVHPSTTAKSGKFDCTMMSLSVLLDYRPDDNKEHTFEVSLFAELFNEMLMRDFGFRIYKSLVQAPEKPKEEEKKDKKKEKERTDSKHKESLNNSSSKDKDSKDKDGKDKDRSSKDKDSEKDSKDKSSSKEKDGDKDKEEKSAKEDKEKEDKKGKESEDVSEEPPAKKKKEEKDDSKDKRKDRDSSDKKEDKRKDDDKRESKDKKDKDGDDDEDDDKKSIRSDHDSRDKESRSDRDKDKKSHRIKMITSDSGLLLAFCYFDLSHTGYLMDKDMEEILHTIGLQLSRAQVRKMVAKSVLKDQLHYHKLTDKPAEKKEDEKEKDAEKEPEESEQAKSPKTETEKDEEDEDMETDIMDDETLAKGNKPLLPSSSPTKDSPGKKPRSKKDAESGNMIMYKGSMLDIASMIQRVEKSEKLKRETDTKLKDLQEEMDMLKDSCKSSEQTSQKVALELQELKKKLRDQRKATDRSENDAKKYYEVLSNAKGNLGSLLSSIQDVTGEKKHSAEIKPEINGIKKEKA